MAQNVSSDSFYVTCTSNKSREYFPDNKTSCFKTKLLEPRVLNNSDRRWEVGVSSFSYSQAIHNFGKCMLMEMYIYDGRRIHTIPIEDTHVSNATEMASAIQDSFASYVNSFKQMDDVTNEQFQAWMVKRRKRKLISEHPAVFDDEKPRQKRSITTIEGDSIFTSEVDIREMARLSQLSGEEFESEFITGISDLITQQCMRKIILICAGLPFLDERHPEFKNLMMYHVFITLFLKHQIEQIWKSIRELVIWNQFRDEDLRNIKENEFFHNYLQNKNPILYPVYIEIMKYDTLMMDYIKAEDKGIAVKNAVWMKFTNQVRIINNIIKDSVYDWDGTLFANINSQAQMFMTLLKNCETNRFLKMGKFARTRKSGEEFMIAHTIFKNLKTLSLNIGKHVQFLNSTSSTKLVLTDELLNELQSYIYVRGICNQYSMSVELVLMQRFPALANTIKGSKSETPPSDFAKASADKTLNLMDSINFGLGENSADLVQFSDLSHVFQRAWWGMNETAAYQKRIRMFWKWFHDKSKLDLSGSPVVQIQPKSSDVEKGSESEIPEESQAQNSPANTNVVTDHSQSNIVAQKKGRSEEHDDAVITAKRIPPPHPANANVDVLVVDLSTPNVVARKRGRSEEADEALVTKRVKNQDSDDDDDDDDDDDEDNEGYQEGVLPPGVGNQDVFISSGFYGLSTTFAEAIVFGEGEKHAGSPLSELEFEVKVVNGNKLEFTFANNMFDFAMSPSLLKAAGFGQRAGKYLLSALNIRINLRECLNLVEDSQRMDSFHSAVYSKFKKGESKYFLKKHFATRERHYDEAGLDKIDFLHKLREKLAREKITVQHFLKNVLFSKQDYMKFVLNVAKHQRVALFDIVVFRLLDELPFRVIHSDSSVNFHPTDLIFIYTNIIVPEDVDNARMRVLEIMSLRVKGASNMDQIEFSNTHYKKLDVDILTDIEFLIATSLGTPVPFQFGPATIQLHFRRR